MAITKATASSIAPAAKGALVVGTGTNDAGVLAVGTNTYTLVADSSEATGLKWAAPAGNTVVGCALTKSANQSAGNAAWVMVTFDGEDWDTDTFHDNSTNTSRITIPAGKGGKYLFNATVTWDSNASGARAIEFYKNGVADKVTDFRSAVNGYQTITTISIMLSAVATDYFEIGTYQDRGGSLDLIATRCRFSTQYLGA